MGGVLLLEQMTGFETCRTSVGDVVNRDVLRFRYVH
jgi:hypothetical protein